MKLNNPVKILLVFAFFAVSIAGFLIKLPSAFRHFDKELHSLFYFLTAAFLNVLFAKRNIVWHALIFVFLYLFGMAIEYSQDYSNKLLHRKIHGRYDVEDVQANLKGLVAFSAIWLLYTFIAWVYQWIKPKKIEPEAE